MRIALSAGLLTTLGLVVSACVPPPVQMDLTGELEAEDLRLEQDASAYDTYRFECARDEVLEVAVSSDDFDPYVFVVMPDGQSLDNDDGGEGWNASMTATVPLRGECAVVVTTYAPHGFGRYDLRVTGVR